jgi:hypothetical protein
MYRLPDEKRSHLKDCHWRQDIKWEIEEVELDHENDIYSAFDVGFVP